MKNRRPAAAMIRPVFLALALLFWLNARPGGVSGQGNFTPYFYYTHT